MDWEDKDPAQIEARVKKQILIDQQGLILFHDTDPQAVLVLPRVLKFLKSLESQKRARVISLCQAVDEINGLFNAEFCPANQFKWRQK
jgi:trehalose-6-phosphatase